MLQMQSSHDKNSRPRRSRIERDDYYHHQTHHYVTKHEKRNQNETPPPQRVRDSHFSFEKYKSQLNKTFSANGNLVNDLNDFWKFVHKYETMEEKVGSKDKLIPVLNNYNSIGVSLVYHNTHSLNISLTLSTRQLFNRVSRPNELTDDRLDKFRDIIIMYIGFKQKEKFAKLKKLRDEQANLPVAKYRQTIIDAVKTERVIIIAGDTGCGKSTQIPQYLYSAGFCKIGKPITFFTSVLFRF